MPTAKMRTRLLWVAAAMVAAVLLAVPAAGAHQLTIDRAEAAAERYADEQVGGGLGQIAVEIGGRRANLSVYGYDSAPCASRGIHRRLCRVTYEGQDFLEPSCRVAPIGTDGQSDTRVCFSRVTCTQQVTVSLGGRHVQRRSRSRSRRSVRRAQIGTIRDGALTLSGSDISCRGSS